MGALNVAAMPPAAPHATRVRKRPPAIFATLPIAEPIPEPINTIGPCTPTEPPVPIHVAEAKASPKTIRDEMRPSLNATASITSGTPCPLASWATKEIISPTINPPAVGINTLTQKGADRAISKRSLPSSPARKPHPDCATTLMRPRNPIAPYPTAPPTIAPIRIMKKCSRRMRLMPVLLTSSRILKKSPRIISKPDRSFC